MELVAITNEGAWTGVEFQEPRKKFQWILSEGTGTKTVDIEFKNASGMSEIISQSIEYVQQNTQLDAGTYVRTSKSGIHYVGNDGKLHPFPNVATFHSWEPDFSDVLTISAQVMQEYQIGSPVCAKPGSWLIAFSGVNKLYAVEPGCDLRPLRSNSEALVLYGPRWRTRVLQLPFSDSHNYTVRSMSSANSSDGIVDQDHDGVRLEVEKNNGSSDSSADTDKDGLSDFEEIYYWLTHPGKKDTDGDSFSDGDEVQSGYSPNGPGGTSSIPENTYMYPIGTDDAGGLFRVDGPYSISVDKTVSSYIKHIPNIYRNGVLEGL
jgi:hypothetical protein